MAGKQAFITVMANATIMKLVTAVAHLQAMRLLEIKHDYLSNLFKMMGTSKLGCDYHRPLLPNSKLSDSC